MHFNFDELFVARNKGVIDTAHHFSRCVDWLTASKLFATEEPSYIAQFMYTYILVLRNCSIHNCCVFKFRCNLNTLNKKDLKTRSGCSHEKCGPHCCWPQRKLVMTFNISLVNMYQFSLCGFSVWLCFWMFSCCASGSLQSVGQSE